MAYAKDSYKSITKGQIRIKSLAGEWKSLHQRRWLVSTWILKSLGLREMWVKTKMRYHFIPPRMTKMEQNDNTKFRQGWGRTEIPIHSWWEAHKGQTLWKAVWQFLMNKYLPYDLVIPFLVENKNMTTKVFG